MSEETTTSGNSNVKEILSRVFGKRFSLITNADDGDPNILADFNHNFDSRLVVKENNTNLM